MKIELKAERGGNNILGSFWRVYAYEGERGLGERVYAGYTKQQAIDLARQLINNRGRLN